MEVQELIGAFEREGSSLDAMLREHPLLRPLFSRNFDGVDRDVLKTAYLRLLKLKADYVQYTVPALLVASEVLRGGDDEDRRWSELLLGYGAGETDLEHDYGHQVWAHADMRALGAAREVIYTPPPAGAVLYARYFIDDVAHHPYAILGAKGVLEHFSIRVSDDLVRGIVESGIANAENATRFFSHHGVLDVEHVREGDRNLSDLSDTSKRSQILEGAYFASSTYQSLVSESLGRASSPAG